MRKFALSFLTLALLSGSLVAQSNQFGTTGTEVIDIFDSNRERPYQLYIKVPITYNRESHQQSLYPVVHLTDALNAFPLASGASPVPMKGQGGTHTGMNLCL